jgi:hypothetical protein
MTAATMSSTLTRSTRACRCSVVVAGVNRLQATSRPSTTLRPTRRTRRECGSGPAAAWRSVCGYVDALARCPACGRRSVSAIPQLCFSTASNRPVTLAPRDDELWAALGLLFLSGQRGALLLQRAVGPHSAVERACHGISTGLEFQRCQWLTRHGVGQLWSAATVGRFHAAPRRPPRPARSSAVQSPEAARGRCMTGVSGSDRPSP